MDIIKHELYKIFSRKAQWITFFVFIAGYLYATHFYYKWHISTSWERIIAFPAEAGALFLGALILIAVAPSFTEEYGLETDVLIISAKRGRKEVVNAKIIASCVYALTASAAFFAVNAVMNIAYAGMKGWDKPLHEIYIYAAVPWNINLLGYFIMGFLICAAASAAYAVLVLYLSASNKSILNVFFIGGILFIIPYFLSAASGYFIVRVLKDLSYTELMRVDPFFIGYRVSSLWLALGFIAAVTVVLAKRVYVRFAKHRIV